MDTKNSKLPVTCPSCSAGLSVSMLTCRSCDTTVNGLYDLPVLLQLNSEELEFIIRFIKNSGSLKEMSKEMELSYPTIRNYLNELIDKLNQLEIDE